MKNLSKSVLIILGFTVSLGACNAVLADDDDHRGGYSYDDHDDHDDDHDDDYEDHDDDDDHRGAKMARLYCYDADGNFIGNIASNITGETCMNQPQGGAVETANPPANGLFGN